MATTLELILNRQSRGKLTGPGPSKEQLDIILKAAGRAPDHACLRPWRLQVYQGKQALTSLGEFFAQAKQQSESDIDLSKLERAKSLPFRAPVVVVAIAEIVEHPKVPEIEQVITVGCSVHAMLFAAQAQGLGGYWRTGDLSYNSQLKSLLGLPDKDHIVGFLYLGTPEGKVRELSEVDTSRYVEFK